MPGPSTAIARTSRAGTVLVAGQVRMKVEKQIGSQRYVAGHRQDHSPQHAPRTGLQAIAFLGPFALLGGFPAVRSYGYCPRKSFVSRRGYKIHHTRCND